MIALAVLTHTRRYRQCSSGLQAIASVAASIKAGYYSVGLAGGVETMSSNPMTWQGGVNPAIEMVQQAKSCMLPMGITSENVAAKFGVTRYGTCHRAIATFHLRLSQGRLHLMTLLDHTAAAQQCRTRCPGLKPGAPAAPAPESVP